MSHSNNDILRMSDPYVLPRPHRVNMADAFDPLWGPNGLASPNKTVVADAMDQLAGFRNQVVKNLYRGLEKSRKD